MIKLVKEYRARIFFAMLAVAIIIVAVWVTWKPDTAKPKAANAAEDIRWWHALPPFTEPTPFADPVRPASTATPETIVSNVHAETPTISSPIARSARDEPNSLAIRTFSPAPIDFKTLAVVDVERLLIVYPPGSDSKEARAQVVADIQRAIAICASAHDFALVFDRAGESLNGVPTVLSAAGAFDLTDEVAQQLASLRP